MLMACSSSVKKQLLSESVSDSIWLASIIVMFRLLSMSLSICAEFSLIMLVRYRARRVEQRLSKCRVVGRNVRCDSVNGSLYQSWQITESFGNLNLNSCTEEEMKSRPENRSAQPLLIVVPLS